MALVERQITVRFELGTTPDGTTQRNFAEGGNTVTLPPLRMSAKINQAGTPAAATLNLQIYGMKLSLMNKLATLGMVYQQIKRNTITVTAGDAEGGMRAVFIGTILQAWTDFSSMPDVAFHIEAQTLGAESVIPAKPTSVNGNADVAQLMAGFASQMSCTFENNGIDARVASPYWYGPPANQAAQCAAAAGISWTVERGILAIWPGRGGTRGGDVPLISPETGLVGYPSFTSYGLAIKTLFNPAVRFMAKIRVKSSLENASGEWAVYTIDHDIECQMPKGRWFTQLVCYNPEFPRQVAARA